MTAVGKPVHYLIDVYSVWLHVAYDEAAWAKLRKQIDSLPEEVESLGFSSRDIDQTTNQCHISVFINLEVLQRSADPTWAIVETIAHEGYHAAGMILDHFGQGYIGTDEHMAYLVGWISGQMWRWLP